MDIIIGIQIHKLLHHSQTLLSLEFNIFQFKLCGIENFNVIESEFIIQKNNKYKYIGKVHNNVKAKPNNISKYT